MEKYYRQPVSDYPKKNFNMHVSEWHTADEACDSSEDTKALDFVIRAFGVDDDGRSVCLSVKGFRPFFYIKTPKSFNVGSVVNYIQQLQNLKVNGKSAVNWYIKDHILLGKTEMVHAKDFYGFSNGENFKFFKLYFTSNKAWKSYLYSIKNHGVHKIYETNLEPLLKFYHTQGIQPSNWITIDNVYAETPESSTCQINIECEYSEVHFLDRNYNGRFLQASFDIETYSAPIQRDDTEYYPFPSSSNKSNSVYQIATCFKILGDDNFLVKNLLTLKKCAKIDDPTVVVIECETETQLLMKWKSLIELMDPDILYQYNGDVFDCKYMVDRAKMFNILPRFMEVSRLLDHPSSLKETTFSSAAYGNTNFFRLSIPGRVNFDILTFIRREYKENSYKLDSISEKYLKEKKNDVKVVDIFKAYETGDPQQIKKIGLYCLQDTLLPQKLVDKLHILQTQISMSNVTYVPIKMLIERGQQIKALSQISMNASRKGYLIPHFEYKESEGKFEGATVLQPEKGIYPIITTLDYASLYPSIIRAYNLCYTTIVMDQEYMNIPGVEYKTVNISDTESAVFAQNTESVLPDLLADLAVQRKKYKKLMATACNEFESEIYNKTQLAYKVSMNSVYGILGSGAIGCKPIAASVTKIGREMIGRTKDYIEENHYMLVPDGYASGELDGDSPVTMKIDGIITETTVAKVYALSKKKTVYVKTNNGFRKLLV